MGCGGQVWSYHTEVYYVEMEMTLSDEDDWYCSELGWGWNNAWVYTGYDLGWDDVDYPYNYCTGWWAAEDGNGGNVSDLSIIERFQSVYRNDHFDSNIEKYVYLTDTSFCNHYCQGPRFCWKDSAPWLSFKGFAVGYGIRACINVPPYPRLSETRPECISPGFGANVTLDDECGGGLIGVPPPSPCLAPSAKRGTIR